MYRDVKSILPSGVEMKKAWAPQPNGYKNNKKEIDNLI